MNHNKPKEEAEVSELNQHLNRERMIHLLETRQKHTIDEFDEWVSQLPAQAKKQNRDSLLTQRGRALMAGKKSLEALFEIVQFLRECPTNLEAHVQYEQLLETLYETFKSLIYLYPHDPDLGRVYDVLIKNGKHIEARIHCDYIKLLVVCGKASDAIDPFLSLSKLYPRSPLLWEVGFELWEQTKDPALARFAMEETGQFPKRANVYFRNKSLSESECLAILSLIRVIEMTMDRTPSLKSLIELIERHTGTEEHIYYVQLKPLYLKKALILDRLGEKHKSFEILSALTAMDPADLTLEICLRTAILGLFYHEAKKDIMDNPKHRAGLVQFGDQVSPYDFLPPTLLVELSLHDLSEGRTSEAIERMNSLMDTNPLCTIYIQLVHQVAQVAQCSSWNEEILGRLRRICEARPWDLSARVL